jgi:hypothetical protein
VVLASMADMMAMVIKHNQNDRELIRRSLKRLRDIDVPIIGAVLNSSTSSARPTGTTTTPAITTKGMARTPAARAAGGRRFRCPEAGTQDRALGRHASGHRCVESPRRRWRHPLDLHSRGGRSTRPRNHRGGRLGFAGNALRSDAGAVAGASPSSPPWKAACRGGSCGVDSRCRPRARARRSPVASGGNAAGVPRPFATMCQNMLPVRAARARPLRAVLDEAPSGLSSSTPRRARSGARTA